MGNVLAGLLSAWREAERRWELAEGPEQIQAAAIDVITAWANYQNASLPADTEECMLVVDDSGTYVAATDGVRGLLGYEPRSLVGQRIADLAVPVIAGETPGEWARFLAEGRQDGTYLLRHAGGGAVEVRYQARAHHPIPGYHVSRLSVRGAANAR